MTDEQSGRRRHVLKRSRQRESSEEVVPEDTAVEQAAAEETAEAPVSLAEEPESGAIEDVADEPTAVDEPSAEESPVEETVATPVADVPTAGVDADEPVPVQEGGFTAGKVIAFIVLPLLAVVLAVGVGWLAYVDLAANRINAAREQAVQTAKDSTGTLLSYNPDTVEQQLTDASGLLTGEFKDSYTQLTTDVVIPGAKQQRISAVATVPRAASVSTETDNAVVLVFVNQTVVVGDTQPSATLSSVRVSLEKVDGRWLISEFDPV